LGAQSGLNPTQPKEAAVKTRRIGRRLADAGWCVVVPAVAVAGYLGIGFGVVSAAGEPIAGTVVLDGFVAALIGVARLVRPGWFAFEPGPPPEKTVPRFGLTVPGVACLAFLAGQSLALWLYAVGGSAGFDQSVQTRQHAGTAATILLTLVAAPMAEETIFRGLVYPLLRRRAGVVVSAVVAALVFGLLHGNVVQFVATLPLALLLALVYERTRMLWPCVLLHLGFNLAATLIPARVMSVFANPVCALLLTAAFAVAALMIYQRIAGKTSSLDTADDDQNEVEDPRAI
jgi:membrane protease YdiL (CAAX protease family)